MKGQTIGFQGQRIQTCNPILDTIGVVLTPIGHIMTVHHLVGMKEMANNFQFFPYDSKSSVQL